MQARTRREADAIRERCRTLKGFVIEAWKVLEPRRPFVDNWHIDAICAHLEAVTRGEITRLLINIPPGSSKSLLVSVLWPAWEWAMGYRSLRYLATSYNDGPVKRDTRKCRDLIRSVWFQTLWPEVELVRAGEMSFANSSTGTREGMAFGSLTSQRGDRLIIDDPHSTKTAESDEIRTETARQFREGALDRLNDLDESAIVVIMQRLHMSDVAGVILDEMPEQGFVHVNIPMRFEVEKRCITRLGPPPADPDAEDDRPIFWQDPRTYEGELMDPVRFTPRAVDKLETGKGEYAWCTPAESPVLMADLSLKPIGEIVVGDKIVGWEDKPAVRDGERHAVKHLQEIEVMAISRSVRAVVKMTLDSGRAIRCTPDHKWYTRRGRKLYAPAKLGSKLMRVCDPEIEHLTNHDDIREAGWLAGFYDADGSVSIMRKEGAKRASSLIQFTQGSGRNLPMCERLERALERFGFDYGCKDREPEGRRHCANYRVRQYYLRRGGVRLYQCFLHVIQPTKWRERMIAGAMMSKFIEAQERVVSIENDGTEEVFGLTTTTGNYVVWGIASSNSGQYQQRPAPREGGMFPVDKITIVDEIPALGRMVRGWDIAGSIKKTSPYTAGCLLKLVGDGDVYICDMQRGRLKIGAAEQLIIDTAELDHDRYGPRCLQSIPQDPGSAGLSQKHQLSAKLGGLNFRFSTESGAKEDRAIPIAAQVQASKVYMLRGPWNAALIEEMRNFPSSAFKDQVDALSRAYAELIGRTEKRIGLAGPKVGAPA